MLSLATLVITVLTFAECSPFDNNTVTYQTPTAQTTLSQKDSVSGRCTALDNSHWARDFYDCFIAEINACDNKNDIIDRMLERSNNCLQTTKRCWLESQGFLFMMENIINEMKTYRNFKNMSFSKEKIKDSACIKFLSVETYRSCFDSKLQEPRLPEKIFHKKVKEALSCTNKRNKICTRTAIAKLDDIVRTLLGVKKSNIEDNEDQGKTITGRIEEVSAYLDDNQKLTTETNQYITKNAEKVSTYLDDNQKQTTETNQYITKDAEKESTYLDDNQKQTTETNQYITKDAEKVSTYLDDNQKQPTKTNQYISKNAEEVSTYLDDNQKQTTETNQYVTKDADDKKKQTQNVDVVNTADDTNGKVKSTTRNTEDTFKSTTKRLEEVKPTTKYVERVLKSTTKRVENTAVHTRFQPQRERNTERYNRPEPKPEPKRWYHYVFAPFISLWNAVKSFFGF